MRLLPSSRRQRGLLFFFLLAGITGTAWFLATREPSYHGKEIRAWVAQLNQTSYPQTNDVFNALLDIGADSLPPLVAELKRKDNVLSKSYSALYRKLPHAFSRWLPAPVDRAQRRMTAAWALGQIGPAARSTAPALVAGLTDNDERVRYYSAEALRYLGVHTPDVVAALARSLSDPSQTVRSRAAEALSEMAPDSQIALPAMIELLNNPQIAYHGGICLDRLGSLASNAIPALIDTVKHGVASYRSGTKTSGDTSRNDHSAHNRAMAAKALGQIGLPTDEVLTTLRSALRYPSSWVHENAAIALAAFGTNAISAIPDLMHSLSETNLRARAAIVSTLGTMGPVATAALPALKVLQTNSQESIALMLNVSDNDTWQIFWLRAAAVRAVSQIDTNDLSVFDTFLEFVGADYMGRQLLSQHPAARTLIPELKRRLATNDNRSTWMMAEFLARIEPKDQDALRAFKEGMASTNSADRAYAAFWQWKLTGEAAPTLKVLVAGLEEPASPRSQSFPQWLHDMGSAARPAVPALRKALWHHDVYTRRNVAKALEKIGDPESP